MRCSLWSMSCMEGRIIIVIWRYHDRARIMMIIIIIIIIIHRGWIYRSTNRAIIDAVWAVCCISSLFTLHGDRVRHMSIIIVRLCWVGLQQLYSTPLTPLWQVMWCYAHLNVRISTAFLKASDFFPETPRKFLEIRMPWIRDSATVQVLLSF